VNQTYTLLLTLNKNTTWFGLTMYTAWGFAIPRRFHQARS
jgi:hypothetical protein